VTAGAALPMHVLERRAAFRAPRQRPPKVNWWALLALVVAELAILVWKGWP